MQVEVLNLLMGSNSYLVFSFRGQDYLSVPAEPARLKRKGLEFYKEISPRRWLFKVALRLAMVARVETLVARESSTPVPKYPSFAFRDWLEQARHELGIPQAQAVVSFPGQSSRRRFYVNLLSDTGEPLAFAKISLDDENDRRLRAETEALRYLSGQAIRSFRMPKVMAEGEFNLHRYLVMETMPAEAKPVPARWESIPQRCRDELASISQRKQRIEDLSWWGRFRDKVSEVEPLAEVIDAQADRKVEVCWGHGDFTSRNICRVDNRVWLFDWENSSSDAPVMTDEVRFFLGMQGRRIYSNPTEVAARLGRRYLLNGDHRAKQNLALALAFLSTCTKSGVICAQYWDDIRRSSKT
jgi:hypothetical protein